MSALTDEILRRRTFAIISHPDAGKSTLRCYSARRDPIGGEVQARGERRRGCSDWMLVERERGISGLSGSHAGDTDGVRTGVAL
jgi:peptide chain release factor 3